MVVVNAFEGAPAYEAGVRVGDRLVEIDGRPAETFTADNARDRLRGPPGSAVRVTVRREGEAAPFELTFNRKVVKLNDVKVSTLLGPPGRRVAASIQ